MKKGFLSILSVLFLFSIVFIAILLLAIFLNFNILWIFLGLWILEIIVAFVLAFSKRRSDVKLRWIMFLIFVPVISLFFYVFFGRQYHLSVNKNYKYLPFPKTSAYQPKQTDLMNHEAAQFESSFQVAQVIQEDYVYSQTNIELLNNPSLAWSKILRDLDQAQNYILINYYIVEDGELYRNLKKLLIKKAKEGVKICFIYDFVGSLTKLSTKEQDELVKEGILVYAYMPMVIPFINWKSNYRDHRKDISIDGKIGYFGGSNIADEYISKSTKFGFWNDEQVRVVGAAVQGIEKIFVSDWKFVTKKNLDNYIPEVGKLHPVVSDEPKNLTQIVASGPNHQIPTHFDILMKLIAQARKRVWLSSPYFVPPRELLDQLRTAALSGIDVRLVLPGISDKSLLLGVSERYANRLFESGVKIYSMYGTFNHTKAYLIDDGISFVGTSNLDYRAFFSDQQTMGLVYDPVFSHDLEQRFEWEFSVAKLNTVSLQKNHNWFKRFCVLLISWASPLL